MFYIKLFFVDLTVSMKVVGKLEMKFPSPRTESAYSSRSYKKRERSDHFKEKKLNLFDKSSLCRPDVFPFLTAG